MTRIHVHTLQAGIHFSTQQPNEHEGGADGQTTLGRWGPRPGSFNVDPV